MQKRATVLTICRKTFLPTFGRIGSLQCRLFDRAHVADGNCGKVDLLLLSHADVNRYRVAEIFGCQSVNTHQHGDGHQQQSERPVTLLHSSYNILPSFIIPIALDFSHILSVNWFSLKLFLR